MPDLWKALGDVYGDGQADGPPVRREPAAADRAPEAAARFGTALPLDDDLAAALSAALVNAPVSGPDTMTAEPVAPVAPPVTFTTVPNVTSPAPLNSPFSLAPPLAPAPLAPPAPLTPPAPVPVAAAAPVAPLSPVAIPTPPPGEVAGRVTTWIAEIEDRNRRREEGPDLAAAVMTGPSWSRVDDDIVPAASRKRRFRK